VDFIFDLQLFGGGKGGGSSSTTVTNRQPTAAENALTEQALAYSQAVSPNALTLNDKAAGLLFNSIGDTQQNFNKLNQNAQNQIAGATQGLSSLVNSNNKATSTANGQLSSLAQGLLPSAYQQNMENSIRTALNNTMGNTINQLGQRGVINSSVTNKALDDISKNAADTVAQQYQNNINQSSGLTQQQLQNSLGANSANGAVYQNLIGNATAPITTAAAAQEAAQQPALNLWNASLGLNGATTGALAASAGQGTTTSTTTNSGGGGLFSGLLGGLF
jgi:hypothetical protein